MKELRISTFAYNILAEYLGAEHIYEELANMLLEYCPRGGTNKELEYHWADITDEDLIIAKLKHYDMFRFLTVWEKQ
jgi:hypothetical protein